MDRKLMIQYLEQVSQMECQVYTLNRVKEYLQYQSEQLGHPQVFEEPQKNEKDRLSIKDIAFELLWSLLRISPVWLIAYFVLYGKKNRELIAMYGDDWSIPYQVEEQAGAQIFAITVTLAMIAVMALFVWGVFREHKKVVTENNHYREKVKKYEALIDADNLRVQKEQEVKAALCAQRDAVDREYRAAKSALDALYGLDIIENEKRYRDFAAVTTFCGYFRKEYVDRFLGPRQAYDRYDEELMIGQIINKLDIIITKLDEIVRYQPYLVELLRDSNDTLRHIEQGNQKMLKSMEAMEENSSLIEYNTHCAAESSRVTAMLTLYNTLK